MSLLVYVIPLVIIEVALRVAATSPSHRYVTQH